MYRLDTCHAHDRQRTSSTIEHSPVDMFNVTNKREHVSSTNDRTIDRYVNAYLDSIDRFRTCLIFFRSIRHKRRVNTPVYHRFQSEIHRMMTLLVNSLYQQSDVFLRELLSNASDALNKLRLLVLTNRIHLESNYELAIRIHIDRNNRMLHVTDTGIGMTHDDLMMYLGTIATSDLSTFSQQMQTNDHINRTSSIMNELIGQFGVGFYSSFLVADRVIVTSKNDNDEQYIWQSNSSDYTMFRDPRGSTIQRGTTVR
jgi:HSP90 family molecular chaperone